MGIKFTWKGFDGHSKSVAVEEGSAEDDSF
jgi:hypothetical protein